MELTLDLIGGKWKSLLLWYLSNNKIMRFSELNRINPKLTQKMLTQQLREMERDGLITRKVYAQVPPKVEYSLTPLGVKLTPILGSLCEWGKEYLKSENQVNEAASQEHALHNCKNYLINTTEKLEDEG
ncbi:helix-turn-helix domain-containing protein [Desulforamulus aquiferis]|uniref:Helix-turn-helix domain-containing protein n=2 Tax=Desulforamulus aquiferis TaxID=1397668 RepID=A0AAW7ZBV5_9FIRM|nr:helix-turn-helix domain-containing protein [Desulforamulus aquiferis]MDO7787159.1 helix-turn-helix domain-containing protein [Desulforamulus aquiferis]